MEDEYDDLFRIMMVDCKDEHVDTKVDTSACRSCKSTKLQHDRANGAIVCTSCGVVNESQIIDEGAEWNFAADDGDRKDPSRCGCPVNPLLENSSMSTMIGKGGGQQFWLMKKIHQQNSMNYIERARYHVFEHIGRICEKGGLSTSVSNLAKQYYKQVSEKKLTRGGVRKGIVVCCILYACKTCNVSRTVKELSQISDVETTKINNAAKLFEELMNAELQVDNNHKLNMSTSSDDLLFRYCTYLGIHDTKEQCKICNKVRSLSAKVEESKILVGKTPSAVASGMIYIVLSNLGYKINKKKLAENHNISIVTLNKIKTTIEDYLKE